MLYSKVIDPSVKNFRSLTDGIDHRWKNFYFWPIISTIGLRFFFLMTTIDLINVFYRQSIIGIDPINVFFTIGAQLCSQVSHSKHLVRAVLSRQTCFGSSLLEALSWFSALAVLLLLTCPGCFWLSCQSCVHTSQIGNRTWKTECKTMLLTALLLFGS
jgi:hypothetical protein